MRNTPQFKTINATSKHRDLVIFGAGHLCQKTLQKLTKTPTSIYDNSANLWGTSQTGIPIKEPTELTTNTPRPFVIICTTSFPEVTAQLKSLGYQEDNDFCVTPLLNDWRTVETLQNHEVSLLFTSGLSSSGTSSAAGGLYQLTTSGDEKHVECIVSGSAHGIVHLSDGIYLIEDGLGVVHLNPDLTIERSKVLPVGVRPHGITWSDETESFYVACSYLDQVLRLNRDFDVTSRINVSPKAALQSKPHHHINDCVAWGESLFVSMFSLTGNWKKDVFDGGIMEFDIHTEQRIGDFSRGLWMPHNVSNIDGTMAVLDSLPGSLLLGNLSESGNFPGFTRGLSWGEDYYYIGQSRNRNFSANIGVSNNISIDSGIVIFDADTKLSRTIPLPGALTEIHGLLSLP